LRSSFDSMFKLILAVLCALALAVAADVSPLAAYGHEESALIEKVDITGDGGIIKYVIKRGEGAAAKKGAQISAHYDGKLTDGKAFDSSRKRGTPFKFGLGGGQVIKCVAPPRQQPPRGLRCFRLAGWHAAAAAAIYMGLTLHTRTHAQYGTLTFATTFQGLGPWL